MEVHTHTNEVSLAQHQVAKAAARAKAKASITDTVELILWLKTEQARIAREVRQLNSQGYQTTALHSYWRILEKQIKALELELIVEQSANLALD
ncbi:hypothetical protein BGX24_008631 [Mortierella sp. AD032]|nr:hypothetical protein BGX24_008631 [Mortierella sp. AD032]